MLLRNRSYRLRIDTLAITSLDITFDVSRSLGATPNTCEITVFNLSEDQRKQIDNHLVNITLEAGYNGENTLIFSGDLRQAISTRNGPDIVTTLSSGDGEKKHRTKRVAKSFGPKTSIDVVIKECAKAMGVGVGNLSSLKSTEFPKAGATFPCGTVLDGNVAEELRQILRSIGWEYSVQNNALQLLPRRQALLGRALLIRDEPNTGLLGTPNVGSDGNVTLNTLLLPDIFPGRRITIETKDIKGTFRVKKADYKGDVAGDDWGIEIVAEPLV